MDIDLSSKGLFVRYTLGTGVNDGALRSGEWRCIVLALDEVLSDLRTDVLEHEAHVPNHGVIAKHGVFFLQEVSHTHAGQGGKDQEFRQALVKNRKLHQTQAKAC